MKTTGGIPSAVLVSSLVGATMFLVGWGAAKESPAPEAAVIDAAKFQTLQDAFDAVPKKGGIVKLPPGEFRLSKPLVLRREDTRIVGSGAATHLINENTEGQPALVLKPAEREKDPKARIWRVQLADFRISGNPKSGAGVRAEGINEIYLHGLSVDHNGGHGIDLIDCYEDPRVSDSILTYNGQAGLNIHRGHDIVVSANQFEENQDALRCVDSFNLCMTGNNLDDHLRHGVVIENTYGSVVSGNMIEECKGIAIILDRDCYGITIGSNVIAHNFGGGVDLRDAWGCAISANTFVLDRVHSLKIGPDSGRIAVTGNSFCDSHIGGKTKRKLVDEPSNGILLAGTSDIVLSGNVFSGLDDRAVTTTGACRRVVLTGNVLTDLAKSIDRKSAYDLQSVDDAVIDHNAVSEGLRVDP